MSSRVYVGNLPGSATETALLNLIGEHGKVARVRMITDRATGRALGYAFAEMDNAVEAGRVIEALDGAAYDGWELTVRTATPNRR
jgi:RNA recognition motif-containing protein